MPDEKIRPPIDYVLLKPLHEKAQEDPDKFAVLAALESLAVIGGCWRGYGKFEAPEMKMEDMVPVPIWVLDTIGAGWIRYRAQNIPGRTLGEALGLEGGGQGKRPAKEKWNAWFRDLGLARDLFGARQTTTYEKAVAEVADRAGVSESTVARAWAEYGEQIQAAAESLTISRSDGSDP